MKRTRLKSIGQSVTEYAVLLAIVAASLIAMQVYLKRGIQGRIRDMADQITPLSEHYEAGRTEANFTTNQYGTTNWIYSQGIATVNQTENMDKTGNEVITPEYEDISTP